MLACEVSGCLYVERVYIIMGNVFMRPILFLCLLVSVSQAEDGIRENVERNNIVFNRTEKIRATYTWAARSHQGDPEAVIRDIHKAEFNTIFLKGLKNDEQGKIWVSAASRYHIQIFNVFNFYSMYGLKGEMPDYMKDYRKVVYKDGREGTAPCPLDETYWNERVVLPEQLDVAGILIDTEMYGLKPHAFLEDVCFCDECFHQFLSKIKKEGGARK